MIPLSSLQPVELRTRRLLLRPWRVSDADAVFAICQDPEIARWTSTPWPYNREHARGFVEGADRLWREGRAATFAIVDGGSGDLLAAVGLHLDRSRSPDAGELGFWCAAAARGRGVVTEACEAVATWGFDTLDIKRLEWYAEVGNIGSRRVAEKLGFQLEGTLRSFLVHDGRRVDVWVASLLPGELRMR